ncbi:MAG: CARDB domain-containing protein [Bacillota bacterium]
MGGDSREDLDASYALAEGAPETLPDLTGSWTGFGVTYHKRNTTVIKGTLTVENTGTKKAGPCRVNFYLSEDERFDETDTLVKTRAISSTPPGGTKEIKFTWVTGQEVEGKYILAVIDATNRVAESNEENNVVASPAISFSGPPGIGIPRPVE